MAAHAAVLLACALAAALLPRSAAPAARDGGEWPSTLDGRALRPLAPSEVEQRFAARFPGRIARFADGPGRQVVLREVNEPTRLLHPAADCWQGIGFAVGAQRLERDAQARHWRCFDAVRAGERVRVCERIEGADGSAYTDTSSWFWAALLGRSGGPWRAITTVSTVEAHP
jgi:hypothetical protein